MTDEGESHRFVHLGTAEDDGVVSQVNLRVEHREVEAGGDGPNAREDDARNHDPARAGAAWAECKARQADGVRRALRQGAAERVTSPEWRELAVDDPRYQKIVTAAERLDVRGRSDEG